jgi:hypothetical protein
MQESDEKPRLTVVEPHRDERKLLLGGDIKKPGPPKQEVKPMKN